MKVIGISLGYNTSAAVVDPEKGIELAISEERLIGEKNTKNFPINAIRKCVEYLIDECAISEYTINIGISSYEVINERTMRYIDDHSNLGLRAEFKDFYSFLKEYIRIECGLPNDIQINIRRVDHHESHMLPAVYMSGFLLDPVKTISVTYDGFGDGTCATIVDQDTNEMLAKEYIENSIALVYQYTTGALGFKEHQHEGKITGLAAFGTPQYFEIFEDFFIQYDKETQSFIPNYLYRGGPDPQGIPFNANIHGFKNMLKLKKRVYDIIKHLKTNAKATDADIAASVQLYAETLITQWISDVLKNNNITNFNMVLSGGLFANVKVNYYIKKLLKPQKLFVLPPMGDEGTSIGSAISLCKLLHHRDQINLKAFAKDKLYLGSIMSDQQVDTFGNYTSFTVVDKAKYEVFYLGGEKSVDPVDFISALLAMEKTVCVSRGYSEFGPRALGNHSILYDAGKKETNDSLNKKLNRTEFMPFAPITIDKYADDLFMEMKGLEKTLRYMTIAVPVTDEFKEHYKAAYHIDYTARPQVLYKQDNPIIYNIIEEYSRKSNKKALINTSFNLHNSPIIFNDTVAYESFVKADLDALFLDDMIIVKRGII